MKAFQCYIAWKHVLVHKAATTCQSLGINENVHGIHLLASSHTDNDGKELITFVGSLLPKYMSIVCICIGFPKYENVASTYLDATQLWIAEKIFCHSSSL